MIRKLLDMTGDLDLCQVIKSLLNNRRFFVQLNDKSKWKGYHKAMYWPPSSSTSTPMTNHSPHNVSWDGHKLLNHPHPVYLGVTLDKTLSFKTHLQNTKAKVNTHNNILRKLVNSKWGADPPTIRATALALCFSTAEYVQAGAAPTTPNW